MCVLILCRTQHPAFPVLIAANREENPGRSTAPPGLHLVGRRRLLCPQDRRHGGTWIGLNDTGLFAALTNWAPARAHAGSTSRGLVTLRALGEADLSAALLAVEQLCREADVRPFQLVLADAERTLYLRHSADEHEQSELAEDLVVLTSKIEPGRLEVPGLARWLDGLGSEFDVEEALDHLVVTAVTGRAIDMQVGGRVDLCVDSGDWRTVSSTFVALSRDPLTPRLRYSNGSPRNTAVRDYSGLSRRLRREVGP